MKVKSLVNFKKEEDIQIQSATHQLGFSIVGGGDPYDEENLITVRLSLVSPAGGTVALIDRMPLIHLLEICASGEGFFELTTQLGGEDRFRLEGEVEICADGALDLGSDGYLSLDIVSPNTLESADIYAVDAPVLSKQYIRYDPTTINGVTKEIGLADAIAMAVRPVDIDSIQVQFPSRSPRWTSKELQMMGNRINDIVSFNRNGNTVRAGVVNFVQMAVPSSNSATITPADNRQFYVYLLKKKSL